jgi:RND family efflux transporter MFP subunit
MKTRSVIVGLVLLAVVAAVIVVGVQGQWLQQLGKAGAAPEKKKFAMPPALIVATEAVERELAPRQKIVGTIMPLRVSKVGSAASGRVEEFLVDEGDWVKAKQPIARLRTATIQAEVDAAIGLQKAKAAELEKLRKSLDEEIKQAKAKLDKNLAVKEYMVGKRTRIVSGGTALSRDEIEEIVSLAAQAKASLEEAQATLDLMKKSKDAKIQEAEAQLEAAAAEVRRLEEQRDRHTAVAPFDGYIVAEHTEAGEWVLQGALIATVAELDEVEVEVPVLENYISYFNVGNEVNVEVPALPVGQRTFKGKVTFIVPQANLKARTFPVKIRVKNRAAGDATSDRSLLLKAGMLAWVNLPVGAKAKGTVVPRDALVLDVNRQSVFVVDPNPRKKNFGKAREVSVEVGAAEGDLIQVIGDVRPGELIVIEGNQRLRPGQEVEVHSGNKKR